MNLFGSTRNSVVLRAIGLLGLLVGINTASAANIVWVSDNGPAGFSGPIANTVDNAFTTNILPQAGHNVIRYNPAANGLLTQEEIDALETNDLIILGRSLGSGAYQGVNGAQWNTVLTKPILIQSSFITRASRIGWFTAESAINGVPTTLTTTNLDDPATAYLFSTVAMNGNTTVDPFDEALDQNTSHTVDPPQGGGVVRARTVSGTVANVIVDWQAGSTVRNGTEVLAGYRMFFASGTREADGQVPSAGKDNLTPAGEAIFLRAVELAINNGVPPNIVTTPIVIIDQPQSITVPERGAATFSLMATGTPQNFQWHRSDNGGASFAPISGARQTSYTIGSTAFPGDNGAQFFATVSNSLGVVTSSVVTLTVTADVTPPTVVTAIGELDPARVRLVFDEPLDLNTVNQSNFEIFLTGTTPDQTYLTFGVVLTNNGTVVELTTDPRAAGENYSIQILDVRDSSSGNNLINPNPLVVPIRPAIQVIGFDTDNDWKYEISGADLTGTGWEQPGYNDSAWLSGPAGLGLDASVNGVPIRTTLPYDSSKLTTYFRKRFQVPGLPAGTTVQLRDVVEDGAIYYINGREIFRHRMPAGAVAYNTSATGAPDPTLVEGPFTVTVTNLIQGENVIAVSVHQSGTTSTDLEFAAELMVTIEEYDNRPPVISVQPQSQTVFETQPAALSVTLSQGSFPAYQWYHNNNLLPSATSSFIQFPSTQPGDQGNYFVVVSNAFGVATSDVATLTVIVDTDAPTIRGVRASSLDTIVVIFSEPVDPASAQTPGNYSVTGPGGNSVGVTATLSNSTAVIVTLDTPLAAGVGHNAIISNIADRAFTPNVLNPAQAPVRMPGSSSGNIVWVSDNPAPNGFSGPIASFDDDVFVTNFLQNAGYNVIRYSSDNSATNLLSAADIAALNTNDLVIVGRSTASGAFSQGQGSQWNTNITAPMIVMSSYLLRTNNLSWFTGADVPDDVQTTLSMTNLASPEVAYLFQDVALRGNSTIDPYDHPLDRNTSMIAGPTAPGGEVIATAVQLGATAIADFPAGTTVRGGTETLAGYRMFFAGGSREVSGVQTAGKDNLTPTGEAIFLRAVELAMNGGVVPNPGGQERIINLSYSGGTFSGAIQTANGVTYEVQYKDNLNAGSWQTLGPIVGDGTIRTFTDSNATGAMRFYQVVIP